MRAAGRPHEGCADERERTEIHGFILGILLRQDLVAVRRGTSLSGGGEIKQLRV